VRPASLRSAPGKYSTIFRLWKFALADSEKSKSKDQKSKIQKLKQKTSVTMAGRELDSSFRIHHSSFLLDNLHPVAAQQGACLCRFAGARFTE
jgi:hypothetical protein